MSSWRIVGSPRDEVELEMNSEPRVLTLVGGEPTILSSAVLYNGWERTHLEVVEQVRDSSSL